MQPFFDTLHRKNYTVFSLCTSARTPLTPVSSTRLLTECLRWRYLLANHPEPVVAVFGRMSVDMIAAWLGAILAHKQPAFIAYPSHKIHPEDYARKLANYVTRFGACLFVGEETERPLHPALLSPADLPAPETIPTTAPVWRSPGTGEPLFLQCGSGTTGLQKAVAVETHHLEGQIERYREALDLQPNHDRCVNWLPLYHDMGLVAAFLLPLLTQTPCVLLDPFEWAANPDWLLRIIAEERGTLCWLPNFAFALLGRTPSRHDLASMRSFINCSEPVSTSAMEAFVQAHAVTPQQLSVCYALAENVFAVSQTPLNEPPRALRLNRFALQRGEVQPLGRWRLGDARAQATASESETDLLLFGCGAVLPDIKLRIDARKGAQVGEVVIGGPCAVPRHRTPTPDRPPDSPSASDAKTDAKTDAWIHTGDLGFLQDGWLYICGRNRDLIIHHGKNIYPQDLEEVVNRHPSVHPGRVCAVGERDADLASENVGVLFESRHFLPVRERPALCAALADTLAVLFDIRCQVINVPRRWLQKTSSGKMARRAVLERWQASRNTRIHLCGDSHVRLFWTSNTSHQNVYQNINACWLGVLSADTWQQSIPFFVDLIERMHATDALVIHTGEPECRTLFPRADDPVARIEAAIDGYRAFFQLLRKLWPGRMAYMTGIPTQPHNIDNGDRQWPVCGEPEQRYRYQALFYHRMRTVCTPYAIHFLDMCTPLLADDGWLDTTRLIDGTHLTPHHQDHYFEPWEQTFGFLDYTLADEEPLKENAWDGTYAQYQALLHRKVRHLAMGREPDWNHLISSGLLDSLAVIELIAMLNRVCGFTIRPENISRSDFESVEGIYQKFGPSL